MLNHGSSDNTNLDNSASGNNEVRGGDAKTLNHGNISDTGSADGVMAENTSERGRESPNASFSRIINATKRPSKPLEEQEI